MLHIYSFVLELIRTLRPTIVLIERKDRDLGRQLRRAAASVVLNLSWCGSWSALREQQRGRRQTDGVPAYTQRTSLLSTA
jgi:hypothetical protein